MYVPNREAIRTFAAAPPPDCRAARPPLPEVWDQVLLDVTGPTDTKIPGSAFGPGVEFVSKFYIVSCQHITHYRKLNVERQVNVLKYLLNEEFVSALCEKLQNEKVIFGTIKVEDLGSSKHCSIELWTQVKEDE